MNNLMYNNSNKKLCKYNYYIIDKDDDCTNIYYLFKILNN